MTAVLVLAAVVPGLVSGAAAERIGGERALSLGGQASPFGDRPTPLDDRPIPFDGRTGAFGDGRPPSESAVAADGDNETAVVVQTVTYRRAPNATGKIDATHRYRVRGTSRRSSSTATTART